MSHPDRISKVQPLKVQQTLGFRPQDQVPDLAAT
jgi:hypothetical protein